MKRDIAKRKIIRHLNKKNWSPEVVLDILGQIPNCDEIDTGLVSDEQVMMIAAKMFGTSVQKMKISNKKENTKARWFCYDEFKKRGYTNQECSSFFNCSHSAVTYGLSKMMEEIKVYKDMAAMYDIFKHKIGRE